MGKHNKHGKIVTITGNMFGGKTTELINRVNAIKENDINNEIRICCFKPTIDNRYDSTKIITHDGDSLDAIPAHSAEELYLLVNSLNPNVVVIDEIQFFDQKVGNECVIINMLLEFVKSRDVILSGLSTDFRGMPFGNIGDILAISDEVIKKFSTCVICGDTATQSQRIVDEKPASWYQNTVLVGDSRNTLNKERYEPRCRNCHEVLDMPDVRISTQI